MIPFIFNNNLYKSVSYTVTFILLAFGSQLSAHPLDPLTVQETVNAQKNVLDRINHPTNPFQIPSNAGQPLFAATYLQEPTKTEVLSGQNITRKAYIQVYYTDIDL